MQIATRPWITAGVALAAAGAIAVTPVAPPLPDMLDIQSRAVRLTALDPITPWVDQFNEAARGATIIAENFALAPGVGLQQAIVNLVGDLQEVLSDPTKIGDVVTQIGTNLQAVLSSLLLIGASPETVAAVLPHTLNQTLNQIFSRDELTAALPPGGEITLGHLNFLALLPSVLPASEVAQITPVLDALSSPLTGFLMGDVGPFISPVVASLNSVEAIASAVQAGDTMAALQALVAAPANVVGSVFNGADLNLDALVPMINQASVLPQGVTLNELDIAFGGLLSPGSVAAGPYQGFGSEIPVVGGSFFNSLGFQLSLANPGGEPGAAVLQPDPVCEECTVINVPSEPVSKLAALVGLGQIIGVLLGDGWDSPGSTQLPPLLALFGVMPPSMPMPEAALQSFDVADIGGGLAGIASLPDELGSTLLSLF